MTAETWDCPTPTVYPRDGAKGAVEICTGQDGCYHVIKLKREDAIRLAVDILVLATGGVR